jgi:hypothetical protein
MSDAGLALLNTSFQAEDSMPADAPEAPKTSKTNTLDSLQSELTTTFFDNFTFSEDVGKVLTRARLLGTFRDQPLVTTSCLLFGLAEVGRDYSQSRRTPQFLWQQLSSTSRRYDSLLEENFHGAANVFKISALSEQEITENVARVLDFAARISLRTYKPKPQTSDDALGASPDISRIAARHLLAALLMLKVKRGPIGSQLILSRMIDPKTLRRRFLEFIIESLPDDKHDEWREILQITPTTERASESPRQAQQALESETPLPEETQPATKHTTVNDQTEVDLNPVLAGFATDYWAGEDLLNIEDDVNALASLVSAWSVEPPLAIGLFGDWGSGKSHFMRKMQQRVEKLSRKARNEKEKKQNEIGYYKNIVQIEFNAWHYIEGNLWASLVNHIFANLRVGEEEDRTILETRRDELISKLDVKKEIEEKLRSKVEEKQNQLKNKQKEVTKLEKDAAEQKDDRATQLAGFRSEAEKQLNELDVPLQVSEEDQQLLKRAGIEPDKWKTAADFRRHYDEIKGFSNRIAAQWNLFKTDRKVRTRVFLAAGLTVMPLLGLLLPTFSREVKLPAGVLTMLGIVATFFTAAVPVWKQFRSALSALEEHDAAVERARQKRIGELQAEVTTLTKTVMDARAEAASITKDIETLEKQINSTTTDQILAEFIDDRASASDYRRHLGLVALIRRDFERLRDLFNDQRKEEKDGKETYHQNRINRIILYIDDLDRCKPERVVEVLQAIHLLLAFPIFVVVVGVDARWVTRSLQESYEWLRREDNETRKKEDHESDEPDDLDGATPHDYLEKIFQIPFWLRPMEDEQCRIFIEGLTEPIRYRPPDEPNQQTNGNKKSEPAANLKGAPELANTSGNGNPSASKANADDAQRIEPPAESADEADDTASSTSGAESKSQEEKHDDDETIDLTPHSLTLSDKEIEYMTSLAKLIGRSPRAVKRFLNCYRLIKVSLPPAKLKEFVNEGASYEYRAVMILLGIITGAPSVSLYVIEEIENWKWEKEKPPTMMDFFFQLAGNVNLPRASDWQRLSALLQSFGSTEESAAMFAALRAEAPRVSRFSFRIGRAEAAGPKRTTTAQATQSRKREVELT